jgi:hypothetical protein
MKPRAVVEPDKRSAWQRKLDEECPYQVSHGEYIQLHPGR